MGHWGVFGGIWGENGVFCPFWYFSVIVIPLNRGRFVLVYG
jgi:hypothetical protein